MNRRLDLVALLAVALASQAYSPAWCRATTVDRSSAGPTATRADSDVLTTVAAYLVDTARAQVFRAIDEGFPLLPNPIPPALETPGWDGVVLRFHVPGRRPIRGVAEGGTLRSAFIGAIERMADRNVASLQECRPRPFRVSVSLYRRRAGCLATPAALEAAMRYGLDGIALQDAGGTETILTPVDYLARGWTIDDVLARYRPRSCTPLDVATWVCSVTSAGVHTVRAATVPVTQLTGRSTLRSAHLAARHLARHQRRDGRYRYEYDPCSGSHGRGYNEVRHAGVTWALLRMYGASGNRAFLTAARRGLRHLTTVLDDSGDVAYVCRNDSCVLGATALALLATLELPPEYRTPKVTALAAALGRGLALLQAPSGDFYLTERDREARRLPPVPVKFYPGECLLALTRLWECQGEGPWSAAARRAARRQVALFEAGGPPCHWTVQGLVALGKLVGNRAVTAAALAQARALAAAQLGPDDDYAGAWRSGDTPTACAAACRLEALGPAIEAARDLGEDVRPLEAAMMRATRFILGQQYGAENSFVIPQPSSAQGAVRRSPTDLSTRMDIDQHVIAALLNASALLQRKGL